MQSRWLRLILAAFASEVLAILIVVAAVAIFGPREQVAAEAYAQEIAQWLGPVGGAIVTLALAYWITRKQEADQLQTGMILGFLVALIDATIIVAYAAPFQWLFVASGIGKVVAGGIGGFLAARRNASG